MKISYLKLCCLLIIGMFFNLCTPPAQKNIEYVASLHDIYFIVSQSTMLTQNWVVVKKKHTHNKLMLQQIHERFLPELKDQLSERKENMDLHERNEIDRLLFEIEELIHEQKLITEQLKTPDQYNDVLNYFNLASKIEDGGLLQKKTEKILLQIKDITIRLENSYNMNTIGAEVLFRHKPVEIETDETTPELNDFETSEKDEGEEQEYEMIVDTI